MKPDLPLLPPEFARAVAIHSAGWLVAANLIGIWLGVCLLWPLLGDTLAPLTYGRWTPLHLNWQLYGWCALPLVGALFAWSLDSSRSDAGRHARWTLAVWTIALAVGGVSWLGGAVSGKLFLDWQGWTRPLLPLAMFILWLVLAWHLRSRWPRLRSTERWWHAITLTSLLPVPVIFFWSTRPDVYPAVNPDSGGATGAALLGSTLGIVTIFLALPWALGLGPRRRTAGFGWALAASWVGFAVVDRGHASHHSAAQVVALGTLLVWAGLLPLYWSRQDWPAAARPWLRAAGVWWVLLILTGWLSFLPGLSERLKFTHALVGHAHLAMAGLVTSVNAAILVVITRRGAGLPGFGLWQVGCAVYVGAMLALGWSEADHQAELFRSEAWTQLWLGVRLLGGASMTAASGAWLLTFIRA